MHYYLDSHAHRSSFMALSQMGFTISAFHAISGHLFVTGIMMGTLLMGLSFGSFYTVIVPMGNEMYGNLEFGKMWGAQITSQATNLGVSRKFLVRWMGDKITSLHGDFVIRFMDGQNLTPSC